MKWCVTSGSDALVAIQATVPPDEYIMVSSMFLVPAISNTIGCFGNEALQGEERTHETVNSRFSA